MRRVTKPDGKYTSTANIRLKAYEDTGLEPGEILSATEMAKVACALHELNQYKELGDIDRLRELVEADRVIGKEIWSEVRYLHIFTTKPGDIERSTVQYVSLLRDGNILCHTKTCAFQLSEVGKTIFFTREAAEAALKGERHENQT